MASNPQLILVRHGESTANRDRLVTGRSPHVELTERGHHQAARAAEQVAELVAGRSVAVYSSDALRARQTAAPIAERLGVEVIVTELLAEQDLGDLECRPVSELAPLPVPEGFDITEIAWGGGESIAEVHARMQRLMTWLSQSQPQIAFVVLVGHGDSMRVLQAVLAGRSHREIDWIGDALANGAVKPC